MSYQSRYDWRSLRSVNRRTGETSVGKIVEGLRGSECDDVYERLTPGAPDLSEFRPASFLLPALAWSAPAAVGGALGDHAYALIQHLMN